MSWNVAVIVIEQGLDEGHIHAAVLHSFFERSCNLSCVGCFGVLFHGSVKKIMQRSEQSQLQRHNLSWSPAVPSSPDLSWPLKSIFIVEEDCWLLSWSFSKVIFLCNLIICHVCCREFQQDSIICACTSQNRNGVIWMFYPPAMSMAWN